MTDRSASERAGRDRAKRDGTTRTAVASGDDSGWGVVVCLAVVLFVSAALVLKGPMSNGAQQQTLRMNSRQPIENKFHPRDPQRYSAFSSQLIMRNGHEDWVAFNGSKAEAYFTSHETKSLLPPYGKAECDTKELPVHCCLGSSSLAGIVMWDQQACKPDPLFRFLAPHAGREMSVFRDMGDVLEMAEGRNLTFIGDSMSSQHAHASECSWLRSGKVKTTLSTREEVSSIFDNHGGFDHKARYGTSSEYTWAVSTTQGADATVKFYMQYRPQPNMTEMRSIASRSDVMVVNFGLHYLKIAQDTFTDEMTALLTALKTFASTPGKTLIWRETSAQHHLSEGGEYPAIAEGSGMYALQWLYHQKQCHPLEFGSTMAPQWRDKLVLGLADRLGYHVHQLGTYDTRDAAKLKHTQALKCRAQHKAAATDQGLQAVGHANASEEGQPPLRPLLYWLPFFRITAERHDLHPFNPSQNRTDCTHFCYTPYLWEPLSEGIAAAIEHTDRRRSNC